MRHTRTTIDCDVSPHFTGAYLRVAGDACAFVETHTSHAVPRLLAALDAEGHARESVQWVVVTHAHLEHAGGAGALLARLPNAKLLAHPRAARHLIDPSKLVASATSVYGAERFERLYGTIAPIPEARVKVAEDGDTFELGDATFRVHHTAGHAKHHMIVDDPTMSAVFTGDTFGLTYPALQRAGRFSIASTSPTDFDAEEARKSLDKVLSLGAQTACLTHYGEVTDLDVVGAQVRAWIDSSERWVEQCAMTDDGVSAMHAQLVDGIRGTMERQAAKAGLSLSAADWKLLETDIDLNAQGLAFVADKRRKKA